MSNEEREAGWLGQNSNYSSYAHGGFASLESARTYIIKQMGGRLIDDEMLRVEYPYDYDENMEKYTLLQMHYLERCEIVGLKCMCITIISN